MDSHHGFSGSSGDCGVGGATPIWMLCCDPGVTLGSVSGEAGNPFPSAFLAAVDGVIVDVDVLSVVVPCVAVTVAGISCRDQTVSLCSRRACSKACASLGVSMCTPGKRPFMYCMMWSVIAFSGTCFPSVFIIVSVGAAGIFVSRCHGGVPVDGAAATLIMFGLGTPVAAGDLLWALMVSHLSRAEVWRGTAASSALGLESIDFSSSDRVWVCRKRCQVASATGAWLLMSPCSSLAMGLSTCASVSDSWMEVWVRGMSCAVSVLVQLDVCCVASCDR